MKTTNALLAIIAALLLWIAVSLTRPVQAGKDGILSVNIKQVAGRNIVYGDPLPVKIVK
ncbi:MAG: hypothetical protein JRH18_08975 [Deltaproteobacteria bacterium]|nr:hypothetical protein [Deltaproteobacteria bacterium]MBW2151786.1 hypothetical protein [Deltaproteobacteria bacterium]